MVTNPYHLQDTEGNFYNQYPEFQIWEDGKKAGYDQAVADSVEQLKLKCIICGWKAEYMNK